MYNQELAKIFRDMAKFLQMEGVDFKPYAFERAADSVVALQEDVFEIYQRGGLKALMEIPGVGKSIAGHIEEYLKKGKIADYEKFKKKLPLNMDELSRVEGLGPKKIKVLYQKLGVHDLKTLEKAAKLGKIAPLFGFGETTEKNILQGLEFLKRDKGRVRLHEALPFARNIEKILGSLPEVEQVSMAGSLRRRKETIGDMDFLVAINTSKGPAFAKASAGAIADFFVKLPGVEKIWGQGGTKASVHMRQGFDMDLRVVPAKSYGSALQYLTGSQDHNIVTRKIAIEQGLKLSEYGVFRGPKSRSLRSDRESSTASGQSDRGSSMKSGQIARKTEEEVYKAIGLDWMPPEMRENTGEIELAQEGKLPQPVELKDIKGDLHIHSNWEDPEGGKNSIEELAKQAMDLGYEYIGISDHTNDLKVERGLTDKELLEQNEYIKKLNIKHKNFRILHGCEANIRRDGSIDVADKVLEKLDYVIAGVHSLHKMEKKEMTERIEQAMRNPHVDIISHPTGRIVGSRDEYEHDFDYMLKIAKETSTILEINASIRLDLRDLYIRRAKNEGVKMIINTDAHQKDQMDFMEYGVSQARRGWAEPQDIINTLPLERLLEYF